MVRRQETRAEGGKKGKYTMTPFYSHFSTPAVSCRLALLEMSRFTVIHLLAHLQEQSITEGVGVITKEPQG